MNHLHELLDDSRTSSGKNRIVPAGVFFVGINKNGNDQARDALKDFRKLATYFACFDLGRYDDFSGLKIVPELIKFPYKTCWFEFSRGESKRRHGLLSNELENGMVDLFTFSQLSDGRWAFTNRTEIDIEKYKSERAVNDLPEQDQKMCLENFKEWVLENHEKLKSDPQNVDPEYIREHEMGIDWNLRNTLRATFLFMCALNCSNVSKVEHKPSRLKQQIQQRKGRPPLFSYWTLEVGQTHESGEPLGGTGAKKRLHLVRGHPRQYRAGKWTWIQAHARGDKSLGMVHKDYKFSPTSEVVQ